MKILSALATTILIVFSPISSAQTVSCIAKSEMREMKGGGNMYQRDEDLNIRNLSEIDFEKLTVTNSGGRQLKIVKVENNIYKSGNEDESAYYFITNNSKTIISELFVDAAAAHVRVLLCK